MLNYQALVLVAYVFLSLILPLRVSFGFKALLLLIALMCGSKYFIFDHFGTWLQPGLPVPVLLVLEMMYAALLLCMFFAMVKDVVLLVWWLLHKIVGLPLWWPRQWIAGIICGLSVFLGISGTISQFKAPDVRTETVAIRNLPAELKGFKIVQLTDLHIGPLLKGEFLRAVTDKVNALEPDLVVITGDFVDGHTSDTQLVQQFAPLADLKSVYGTYAITGNHEYYSGAAQWLEVFEGLGLHFLENENVRLTAGNASLYVAGVPDGRGTAYGFAAPDANKALQGIPSDGITVFLTHEPAEIEKISGKKPELMLSGHTHGGTMFFLKPLIAHFNAGFVSGRYDLGEQAMLYVSNGTGIWSGFSCRVGVPAEITLFELQPAS